jgi:hypothetical protein
MYSSRFLLPLLTLSLACGGAKTGTTTTEEPKKPEIVTPESRGVRVSCDFDDGWAALVPWKQVTDDEYLMQTLIGLVEDPDFYSDEYAHLEPYKAQRCTSSGTTFDVPQGKYMLMVGRADTYDKNGEYRDNGYKREVVIPGESSWTIRETDLVLNFPCISCPHLYVWDGAAWDHRGEILRDVVGPRQQRTERTKLTVPVRNGELRLRIAEEEDEVSHLDAIVVELDGKTLTARADLGAADGTYALLRKGEAIELTYKVNLPDGDAVITLAATGYYVPLGPLR